MRAFLILAALAVCPRSSSSAEDPQPVSDRARLDEQFAVLTERVPDYTLAPADSRKPFELVSRPVLRWTNPVRQTPGGGVFLWTRDGRVAAIMCAFWRNDREYKHEFQSLSDGGFEMALDGATVWTPQQPGVMMIPDPSMTAVAKTRPIRLTQMRRIAQQFQAFVVGVDATRAQLRLLPQPLYRYGARLAGPGVLDGALFAYVQSTDPEVLLLVEAHSSSDKEPHWKVAFARMSRWKQFVQYKEQTVWSCEWTSGSKDEPYVVLSHPLDDSL